MDKPLFIPLNAKHYEAFEDGSKITEYRLNGKRWNRKTCYTGRAATLSKGYGKKHRMHGTVGEVGILTANFLPFDIQIAIEEIYGQGNHEIICISIDLLHVQPVKGSDYAS